MSNTTRPPLLSDKRIGKAEDFYDECTGPQGFEAGAEFARDYYESLITSGKLRVVEECGYVPPDTWCSVCICKGCGEACSEIGEKDPYPHCPYCTRKIRR